VRVGPKIVSKRKKKSQLKRAKDVGWLRVLVGKWPDVTTNVQIHESMGQVVPATSIRQTHTPRNRGRRRLITTGAILRSRFWVTYRAIVRAISRSWRRWRASPRKYRSTKRGDEGAASSCDNDLETAAENERVRGEGGRRKKMKSTCPFQRQAYDDLGARWTRNAPEDPIGIVAYTVFPATCAHTRTIPFLRVHSLIPLCNVCAKLMIW